MASLPEVIVDARGVTTSFSGRTVLRGVNLRLYRGQLAALIGPNGSGKTTLLRCLLGLQPLDAGTVTLFGETEVQRVLPRIGYVPQKLALEPSFALSVREFLALRLRRTGRWFWRRHARTDETLGPWVAEIGVAPLLDRPLAQLSGGELQRVLIAFGLLAEPELLLLDEPTAGVDTPGELTFYELIAEVQRRRRLTVLLVSHDLSMVCRHADWIYALNGEVCCEGPPETVMTAESLRQAFGAHASPYQHHHDPSHVH
jgi:ABC-type Mn2+/Zn2+ transport system ATPase subunit